MLFAIGALLLLSLAPLLPGRVAGTVDTPASIAVQAAPRMMFNIEQPVTLSRSPFLQLERGRFSVTATAEAAAERRLILEGATLRLDVLAAEVSAGTDTYGPEALSPLMTQLAALGLDKLTLRGASLQVTGANAPTMIGPIDAEIELGTKGQIAVRGLAVHHGEALVVDMQIGNDAAAGQLPSMQSPTTASARRPLALMLKGETLGEVRFDGTMSGHRGLALSGGVIARLASPAALSRWLGAPVRHASALRNIALAGQARWADGILDLQDARVTLDGQKPAAGVLRARFRGARPIVEGTLAFTALDLSKVGATEDLAASWTSLAATLARDLPAYLDVDADMRLSATSVLLPNGARGKGAATVTIDKGTLVAELADAEWNGNTARLHIDADSRAWWPTFAVRGRADLLQVQDATAALTGHAMLSGPATILFDLKGRGEPFATAPPVLAGKVSVSATAGARSLFDPFKVSDRPLPTPRTGHPLLQATAIPVDAVELRLSLNDRYLVVDQSTFKTAGGTATVVGRIDRSNAALELLLVRSPAAGSRSRSPLRSSEQPLDLSDQMFAVTGTWQVPSIRRTGSAQP